MNSFERESDILFHADTRVELQNKAKQLLYPVILVDRARTGLFYLLLGKPRDWAMELITDGESFLQILEQDLECEEQIRASSTSNLPVNVLFIGKRQRYYHPQEVIPSDLPDIKDRITKVRETIGQLTDPSTASQVEREKLIEALGNLKTFRKKYWEGVADAMSEINYGPEIRMAA